MMLALIVMALAFVAGSVLGSILGTGAMGIAEPVLLTEGRVYAYEGFPALFLSCCGYYLAALFFASSLLGLALIPATLALRGFVLSCTAASLAAAYPGCRWALTFAVLGLPAAFSVPGLFIVGFEGMRFSGRLLSVYMRRAPAPAFPDSGVRIAEAFALAAVAAAAELLVVPGLVSLILK